MVGMCVFCCVLCFNINSYVENQCGEKQLNRYKVPAGTKNSAGRTFQVGTYLAALIFYVGINNERQTQTQHKHPHHGGLPPPPAARILQLDPIWRKPDAGEGLWEGRGEAI